MCRSTAWDRARAQCGATQERSPGLCRGQHETVWGWRWGAVQGCAWAQLGTAQGSNVGLRRVAACGCAGVQRGVVHRRSRELSKGAVYGCAGV